MNPLHLFAEFDPPAIIGTMIPVIIFMIPIVAILTKHQQKMAEIFHANAQSGEVNDLRREVADLRSLVHQQSFALDQLRSRMPIGTSDADLSLRINKEQ